MQHSLPIVLASASPRRAEILRNAGFAFEVITAHTDELWTDELAKEEVPAYLAVKKAKAVLPDVSKKCMIVAADTIVLLEGQIMGKPRDEQEAFQMLEKLSASVHQVITGICLIQYPGSLQERVGTHPEIVQTFSATTEVEFDALTKSEISHYIDNFQPFDKAGAYAIQEWIGMNRIKRINGCYYNVVGLPMSMLYVALKKAGC